MFTPVAADTIYIHAGPNGETQIKTPWGDYAVYDEGGGMLWVGTQREFDRDRVIGIMKGNGERLSTVNEPGATASFVSESTFRTQVGGINLDGMTTTIGFGWESDAKKYKRPAIPSTSRYVAVAWVQLAGTKVIDLIISDPGNHQTYHAYWHGYDGHYASVEFSIPRSELSRKVLYVFVLPNAKPGVIGLRSIAWADHYSTAGSIEEFRKLGIAPDPEQLKQLARLEQIEPDLRVVAKRPATQELQPSAPLPSLTPDAVAEHPLHTYEYSGTINDRLAGSGTFEMRLHDDGFGKITGGTWSARFTNSARNNSGSITAFAVAPNETVFNLQSSQPGNCTYHVIAQWSVGYTATYEGLECSNGGTFTVKPVTP